MSDRTDRLLDLDQIHARLTRRTPQVPTRLPAAVSEEDLMQGYTPKDDEEKPCADS